VDEVNCVVVLAEDEARLIAHVLAVFEQLLRLGALDYQQPKLLVPDGVMAGFERPDVEMAEVVVEAGEPLHRQLMRRRARRLA
jgi:hypothetical protein